MGITYITSFLVIKPCSLFFPADGGSRFLRDADNCLKDYAVLCLLVSAVYVTTTSVTQIIYHRWLDSSEWWIGENMEGSGSGLIWGTVSEFAWSDWGKQRKPQSGWSVSSPTFELTEVRKLTLEITCLVTQKFGETKRSKFIQLIRGWWWREGKYFDRNMLVINILRNMLPIFKVSNFNFISVIFR
jgi:hypothetical protein